MSPEVITDVVRAVMCAVLAGVAGYPIWRGAVRLRAWHRRALQRVRDDAARRTTLTRRAA